MPVPMRCKPKLFGRGIVEMMTELVHKMNKKISKKADRLVWDRPKNIFIPYETNLVQRMKDATKEKPNGRKNRRKASRR